MLGRVVMLGMAAAAMSAFAIGQTCIGAELRNGDSVTRGVEIIRESSRRLIELKPGVTIADLCREGCNVRVDGDREREFIIERHDQVSIENGLIYFDGEAAGTGQKNEIGKTTESGPTAKGGLTPDGSTQQRPLTRPAGTEGGKTTPSR